LLQRFGHPAPATSTCAPARSPAGICKSWWRPASSTATPLLVVACYPTMGLDLAAARDVAGHLQACADRGAAVVWISEDLEVLLERADRVAVLHRGRLLGPIPVAQATRPGLGAWMTGAAA
jgi:ABC-type uncharacterized transport system ATPase subunit